MLDWKEILIRLSVAALFGALIGLERERKDWAAGMRTHMMVSVGSCLIMIVSGYGFMDVLSRGADNITLDPSRVAAQVVSGIGFIGAGTILFIKKGIVRGLTTAAGLWTVAAIGLATGGGMYIAAGATTVIALIILFAIQPLEKYVTKKFKHKTLRIVAYEHGGNQDLLQKIMTHTHLKISSFTFEKLDGEFVYELKIENFDQEQLNIIISELKEESSIKEIVWSES